MGLVKSLTKAEAKFLRDLGVAKDDFLWIDNEISIHQTTSTNTRINFNMVFYKVACEEFGKAPLQYTVSMNDAGQPSGKTLLNYIDWNL